jgi:cell division protein FtsL
MLFAKFCEAHQSGFGIGIVSKEMLRVNFLELINVMGILLTKMLLIVVTYYLLRKDITNRISYMNDWW